MLGQLYTCMYLNYLIGKDFIKMSMLFIQISWLQHIGANFNQNIFEKQ